MNPVPVNPSPHWASRTLYSGVSPPPGSLEPLSYPPPSAGLPTPASSAGSTPVSEDSANTLAPLYQPNHDHTSFIQMPSTVTIPPTSGHRESPDCSLILSGLYAFAANRTEGLQGEELRFMTPRITPDVWR